MKPQLLISCEHASNEVPQKYKHLFLDAEPDLNSHKGWDPGALEIAFGLGEYFNVKPFIFPYSRLLIEPNRSLDSKQLFSTYSNILTEIEKEVLINKYYLPYRKKVEDEINNLITRGPVLHLGIHTFTSFWKGKERTVDIGVLFDPGRFYELKYGNQLTKQLKESQKDLDIKTNEPYLGTDDGFTTYLRSKFDEKAYMGFEIEVSQSLNSSSIKIQELLELSIRSLY